MSNTNSDQRKPSEAQSDPIPTNIQSGSTNHPPKAEPSKPILSTSSSTPIESMIDTLASTSLSSASESTLPTPNTSTSASTTSIASLSSSDQITGTDTGSAKETGTGTGMTSPQYEEGEGGGVMDDAVARYKEGLYAYTRGLYIQAKLSSTKKDASPSSASMGRQQSGMEKMAAKKALARRLNG